MYTDTDLLPSGIHEATYELVVLLDVGLKLFHGISDCHIVHSQLMLCCLDPAQHLQMYTGWSVTCMFELHAELPCI